MKMRYIPLLNIVVSIVLSLLLIPTMTLVEKIIQGFIIGLSASGFCDVCKSFKKEENGGIENGRE